ncbi:MAG: nucleoside triphosphate pyrophosphohydrolase, partial [Nocardioidaceae bacterium]
AQGRGDDGWSIDDVAEQIVTKLVHRNPHVFGDAQVTSAAEVDANWQALKAAEKGRTSALEGIPATLPALAYADKVLDRLERQGVVAPPQDTDVGSRLLLAVHEARAEGVDAEAALRAVVRTLVASAQLSAE